jgi:N-acetylmuramoyl-L-alanine amidase
MARTVKNFILLRLGLLAIIGAALLLSTPCPAASIVLDPGHGGNVIGAGHDKGFSEKQFTLALAQQVAALLSARHEVVLTRTADVAMSPADRAAVANHRGADLMISLHAGVAPYCGKRIAAIYYHNDDHLAIDSSVSMQNGLSESDIDRPPWTSLQSRHQHQSQYLASSIRSSFLDSGAFDRVSIRKVPLVTLMGADLPAVLIEVGCIHPPPMPSTSFGAQEIDALAQSIASAIEAALNGLIH